MLRGSGVDAMLSMSVGCSSIHTSWRRQRQPAIALLLIFHCRFFYLYHFIPYAFFVRMNGIYWMFPFVAHWCLLQVWGWGVGGVLLQVCVGGEWGAAAGVWEVGGVLLQVCGGWVGCCCRCGVGGWGAAAGVWEVGGVLLHVCGHSNSFVCFCISSPPPCVVALHALLLPPLRAASL